MKGDPTCALMDDLHDSVTRGGLSRGYLQYQWLDHAGGTSE
jgi:hypothetical protein